MAAKFLFRCLIICVTALCLPAHANADISGKITDLKENPIAGASVVCLSLPDSTYINAAISDSYGDFIIPEQCDAGNYLLAIHSARYESEYRDIHLPATEPIKVCLELKSNELNEVVVSAHAPQTSRVGNKFIFRPNALADQMYDARELMGHVPLVKWGDKTVEIEGRGPSKVYINGKDPHWSQEEISAKLRTLDPRCIKYVEIITDPGASQSASFTGGIVNIVYDDPTQGFVGNAATSVSLSNDRPIVNPNLYIGYQKGRFRASANLGYGFTSTATRTTNRYEYRSLGRTLTNESYEHAYGHGFFGSINAVYDITRRSSLGISVFAHTGLSKSTTSVSTTTLQDGKLSLSDMNSVSKTPLKKPGTSYVLYYSLTTDDKGSSLSAEISYGTSSSKSENRQTFSGIAVPKDTWYKGYSLDANAQYQHIFKPGTYLDAGMEYKYNHRLDAQTLSGESSRFKYNDGIASGYVQFAHKWNKAFSSNIGLRLENTRTYTHQSQEGEAHRHDDTDLFPSLSVSWTLPRGGQSLSLSYSKTIMRPFLHDLDPYKSWTSDNSYYQGNPDLKASTGHYVSLYYRFLNGFIFNASYSYSSPLNAQYTIDTPEGYSISSITNAGRRNSVSFMLSLDKMPTPFWMLSSTLMANYKNEKIRTPNTTLTSSCWGVEVWLLKNTFILSKRHRLKASLSNLLMPPHHSATYSRGWRDNINVGLNKVFSCGLVTSLNCQIPLGFKHTQHLDTPDYSYDYITHGGRYTVTLNLSYTFGKSQVQGAREKASAISL